MKSNLLTIRPITHSDVIEVYGRPFNYSIRGFSGYYKNELLGVAGVTYSDPIQAFSTISDDRVRKHPRFIVLMARRMRELMSTMEAPIFAVSNGDEPTSERFLKYVGFEFVNEIDRGTVFKWRV